MFSLLSSKYLKVTCGCSVLGFMKCGLLRFARVLVERTSFALQFGCILCRNCVRGLRSDFIVIPVDVPRSTYHAGPAGRAISAEY